MRSDTLNLQKLFEMQKALDKHIEQEHPRHEGEDRLAKKILALRVELGELANEWRGFKFWSKDQKPRTKVLVKDWFEGLVKHEEFKNPLLEEYVDCLHFILSIGLDIGFKRDMTNVIRSFNALTQFNNMFNAAAYFYNIYTELGKGCGLYDSFDDMLGIFIGLGKELGFTWEQIEEAYLQKNAINHKRMESGY
jgi:dimeric dUTPase (all-alpha-NTP-PPase superfamily)